MANTRNQRQSAERRSSAGCRELCRGIETFIYTRMTPAGQDLYIWAQDVIALDLNSTCTFPNSSQAGSLGGLWAANSRG